MMRADYGNDKTFRIEIKDLEATSLSDSAFFASYQEWQYWDDQKTPKMKKQCTSVLHMVDEKPKWLVIHETQIGYET